MLSYKGVTVFERTRKIRRDGLTERNVSLGMGFEVSKDHARLSLSISAACGSGLIMLSYFSSTMPVCLLPYSPA